jgi:hypothetical protein
MAYDRFIHTCKLNDCKDNLKRDEEINKSINNHNHYDESILYLHPNFMDCIELSYLLDYYVNENSLNKFCCFLFGTKKLKENSKTIKSIVIPNKYINEFNFSLVNILDRLTDYIRSMYKCYNKFEFIGLMMMSSSGFFFF